MSHPDPRHDPENVKEYDWSGVLEHEKWYEEYETFMEWQEQMNRINDEEQE